MGGMRWILLPGLDGTGDFFEPFIRELPAGVEATPIRFPRDQPLGYEELFEYVRQRLPAEPFLLVAESFSGPLAVRLAAAEPPGMIGAVVSASFVRNPLPSWLRFLARPALFSANLPEWVMRAVLAGNTAPPQIRHLARKVMRDHEPEVVAHRARAALQVDATEALKTCRLPLLFLTGDRDNLIRRHNRRLVERLRPDVKIVSFDSPHFLLQLHAREALAAIEAFLESNGRGGA
jgi:pimeloyl-[acyl-carrier protein] methyl ester esterase